MSMRAAADQSAIEAEDRAKFDKLLGNACEAYYRLKAADVLAAVPCHAHKKRKGVPCFELRGEPVVCQRRRINAARASVQS